jgi:hypothetical protein
MKLNGKHQLLAYVDDINVVGGNIDTIKKNTEASLDARKGWSSSEPRENYVRTYMLKSPSQKIGQKRSIKVASRSFEDVVKLKYLDNINR